MMHGVPPRQFAVFVARSLGVAGWLGLALLITALGMLVLLRPTLIRGNAVQAQELVELRTQWQQLQDPANALAARDPLAALVASLPPASKVPDFLTQLQKRAERDAVQIDRTEYRVRPALGAAAERYRLSFPAHVDYPHLRVWLEELLHDYPSLALEDLAVHRAVDGGEELDAHIGLSFLAAGANATAAGLPTAGASAAGGAAR